MKINNYEVNVFNPGQATYIYMPIEMETAKAVSKKYEDLTIVGIDGFDWDNDLTFWSSPNVFEKKKPFGGNGKAFLDFIETQVIQQVEKDISVSNRYLLGYSLGGLFSLLSSYESNWFSGVASVSGSLWYPELLPFIESHQILTKKVYLSLGEKEKNSKNELIKTVEDNTVAIENLLKNNNVEVVFQLNQGNHFMEVIERINKAIIWLTTGELKEEQW